MAWRSSRKTAFALGFGATALVPSKVLAGGACALAAYGAVQLGPRLSLRTLQHESWSKRAYDATKVPGSRRHVRILSQNVWNSFFAGGPGRIERLRAFGEYLEQNDVDIVATQEMFVFGLGPLVDSVEANTASDMMRLLGFEFQTCYLESAPAVGQSSGLVVYSKLPIVRAEHHVFSSRRAVSCKGWLEVEVELPTRAGQPSRLTLFNTHLEHAHSQHWRHVREQQWREIVERASCAQRSSGSKSFAAVLGDFNVCSDEFGTTLDNQHEYSKLKQAMTEAGLGFNVAHCQTLPTLRREASHRGLRCSLDHVFVDSAFADRVTNASIVDTRGSDGLAVSDHHGVHVELSL